MREHMLREHPTQLKQVLTTFVMSNVKQYRSALGRQISQDSSQCLLNSKEEYNQCILPFLQATHEKEQSQVPKLSAQEEDAALTKARQVSKKRVRNFRADNAARRDKRIKLYKRDQAIPEFFLVKRGHCLYFLYIYSKSQFI